MTFALHGKHVWIERSLWTLGLYWKALQQIELPPYIATQASVSIPHQISDISQSSLYHPYLITILTLSVVAKKASLLPEMKPFVSGEIAPHGEVLVWCA